MSNKIADLQKTLKKNKNGYNYKYVDLAGIHEMLADAKISYWQETVSENNKDYIFTHVIDDETGEQIREGRGSEIVPAQEINGKLNPPQAMGSSISYSRRYSLLLILGLAAEDDDAESLTQPKPTQAPAQPDKKPESGRYGAPAGRIDFKDVEAKLATVDNVSQVDAYFEQLKAGDMSWRQKAALEAIFKKRKDQIREQH